MSISIIVSSNEPNEKTTTKNSFGKNQISRIEFEVRRQLRWVSVSANNVLPTVCYRLLARTHTLYALWNNSPGIHLAMLIQSHYPW